MFPQPHLVAALRERLTTTFVGALTLRGSIAPFVLDGAINRDAFETYVAKVLVPELRAGDVGGYWLRLVMVLAAAIVASVVSRYVVELPAMRLRKYVLKHPNRDAEHEHPPLPLAPM